MGELNGHTVEDTNKAQSFTQNAWCCSNTTLNKTTTGLTRVITLSGKYCETLVREITGKKATTSLQKHPTAPNLNPYILGN